MHRIWVFLKFARINEIYQGQQHFIRLFTTTWFGFFFCLVPRGHFFYVKCLISRCINTTCPIALHFNPQQIILRSFQVDIMLIISFDCIQFGKCIYFWLFFTCIERCSDECESFRRQNVWIGVRWVNQIKQWTNLKSNYSTHIPNCECWNNS